MPPKATPHATRAHSSQQGDSPETSPPAPPPPQRSEFEQQVLRQLQLMNQRFDSIENRLTALENRPQQLVPTALTDRTTREPTHETIELPERPKRQRTHGKQPTKDATKEEIGFLRPDDDTEAQYTEGKHTVYADVTLFIRKLKRLSKRRTVNGDVISDCLQGKALGWFDALSEEQQEELEDEEDIETWCKHLERFKISRPEAMNRLKYSRYTIEMAASDTPLTSYFDHVSRLCRALDCTDQQVKDWLYENMYSEIASELIDLKDHELPGLRNAFTERQALINQKFFHHRPPPQRDRLQALPAPPTTTLGTAIARASGNTAVVGVERDYRQERQQLKDALHKNRKDQRRAYFTHTGPVDFPSEDDELKDSNIAL